MHPPLSRPHPDCQTEIKKLSECHGNWRKFIGACNEIKASLDVCLKEEKKALLRHLNQNWEKVRQREEDAIADALGHKGSFQDYLSKDPDYLAAKEKTEHQRADIYQKNSTGGHVA